MKALVNAQSINSSVMDSVQMILDVIRVPENAAEIIHAQRAVVLSVETILKSSPLNSVMMAIQMTVMVAQAPANSNMHVEMES
jgi:hypothetical protein